MNKFDGLKTYTDKVALRKITFNHYLKITFSNAIQTNLGSLNIFFGGRGATGTFTVGSSSFANYVVTKQFSYIADYLVPNLYVKDTTSNYPIYIDTGGGQSANVMIMSQNVGILSIEDVDTIPEGYEAH